MQFLQVHPPSWIQYFNASQGDDPLEMNIEYTCIIHIYIYKYIYIRWIRWKYVRSTRGYPSEWYENSCISKRVSAGTACKSTYFTKVHLQQFDPKRKMTCIYLIKNNNSKEFSLTDDPVKKNNSKELFPAQFPVKTQSQIFVPGSIPKNQ